MSISRRSMLLLAGASVGGFWLTGCAPRGAGAAVRIGANLPLSGPLAVYGTSVREGVEYYLRATDGAAQRLAFDWQDNASDPANAVRIAGRQLEGAAQAPNIYVSGVKPQTMAIMSDVAEAGLPHFVWIFDPQINASGPGNNFRTWVSYKIEPEKYYQFVQARSASKVAIAYVQLPHTVEEFESAVIPTLRQRGVQVTTEVFEFGRTDFREIARRLVLGSPDAIILNGFQLELSALVRALRQEPRFDAARIVGTYDMLDAAEVLSAEELEGIRVVTPEFSTRRGREANAQWIEGFTSQFNKAPLYTHAFAYDMAAILDGVARSNPLPADNAAWVAALRATELQGVTGPLSFDGDGDLVTPLVIGVFQAGQVEIAPENG